MMVTAFAEYDWRVLLSANTGFNVERALGFSILAQLANISVLKVNCIVYQ